MKIIQFIIIALTASSLNLCCQAQADTEKIENQVVSHTDEVEVFYFHYTRRCVTCKAVEDVSRDAIAELYGETVPFTGYNLEEEEGKEKARDLDVSGHQLFIGEGCEECNNTGYNGRIAIYEVMPMLDKIQELILKGESARAIKDKTEEFGLVSLQDQGFSKVIKGITTLDEWMRVVA